MTGSYAIVVPVYRHGREAARLAARLAEVGLPAYFVDDGNEAETARLLQALPGRFPHVRVIRREENGGKGAAVLTGLKAALADGHSHALQIDSDGQHNLADIPRFLAASRETPQALISGHPQFDVSAPLGRRIGRQITRLCVWLETLSLDIVDPMCGFRVYPLAPTLQVADSASSLGRRMDFDVEILVRLHWAGVAIRSLPTVVIYPEGGVSNFRMLADNGRISWMHTRLILGMVGRGLTGRLGRTRAA
ncbi:glycosyltransferase family 2 protein [Pedomonas mirosovicensis]|uniref:glycosyltransferase family 2 protein n=1 Tax=Pedomonas mirosovicensis TaxID=2908641 RepID=UPI0021671C99|nr:glycosyltransferase family 2 protein [Pedomonas mirosovicensis]MCH8686369.1 glycosyltransferase family 2 protein [Pedomonas mirosovicensis]